MTLESPKVTVLISTYNRPDYLREAVQSVVDQTLTDWELLVMNDGGVDVAEVINSFGDPRIRYFHDEINRGLPCRFNFGLREARGEYIAYLGDDDLFYPNHLEVLARALDENPEVEVSYSDLYAVSFVKDETTGRRIVLDKTLKVTRDFNRDFMFHYNHALHVSVMHRKEIARRVGGYDEQVSVLIDWNLNRKMVFYTDFKHVPIPTGEYYMPIFKSDRISVVQRKDKTKYKHNLRKIKGDLPPEPWPKAERLAVVFPVLQWDGAVPEFLGRVIDHLSYPVRYVLVNNDPSKTEADCRAALGLIGELKNVHIFTPTRPSSVFECYRFGAQCLDVDYVFLISKRLSTKIKYRLFNGLAHLKNCDCDGVKWDVEAEKPGRFDVLMRKSTFLELSDPAQIDRTAYIHTIPNNVAESFKFDLFHAAAMRHYSRGEYQQAVQAVEVCRSLKQGAPGSQFYGETCLKIDLALGRCDQAAELFLDLIQKGYAPDNWVRLGAVRQAQDRYLEAIEAYRQGLEAIGLKEADLESSVFPISFPQEFNSFTALIGQGDCLFELGRLDEAARFYHLAAKLRANSHRPFLGFAKIFLAGNRLDQAEAALANVGRRDGRDPETHRILGKLCERRQRPDLAFGSYLKAFESGRTDEKNIDPLYYLGAGLGKWAEMKPVLERFVAQRNDHPKALSRLAAVLYHLGQHQKAEETAGRALALEPNNSFLLKLWSKIKEARENEKPPGPASPEPQTENQFQISTSFRL